MLKGEMESMDPPAFLFGEGNLKTLKMVPQRLPVHYAVILLSGLRASGSTAPARRQVSDFWL